MCKIYVATGKLSQRQIEGALLAASRELGKTEKDGFGFVVVGETKKENQIAYGRYLNPSRFCGFRAPIPQFFIGDMIEKGIMPENPYLLICHGRTSTNKVRVENCHPFERKGLYLVHNGILDWNGKNENEPKSRHGCDSDAFLTWLADGGDIEKAHEVWGGFAAIFLYDTKNEFLKLIKDDTSRLHMSKRKAGGWVFGTTEENVTNISRGAGISLQTPAISMPKCIVGFDQQGEMKHIKDWKGFGSRTWDYQSNRSYGGHYTNGVYCGGYGEGAQYEVKSNNIEFPLKRTHYKFNDEKGKVNESLKVIGRTNSVTIEKEKFPDYEPNGQGAQTSQV